METVLILVTAIASVTALTAMLITLVLALVSTVSNRDYYKSMKALLCTVLISSILGIVLIILDSLLY